VPKLPGRAGPVGLALTAVDIWRRLPPEHRKRILEETRRHGPRIAAQAVKLGKQAGQQALKKR
jgi:hypothetical protein